MELDEKINYFVTQKKKKKKEALHRNGHCRRGGTWLGRARRRDKGESLRELKQLIVGKKKVKI